MGNILSAKFWVSLFLSTFLTMLMIYLIKRASRKVQIPIVNDIVEGV